VKQRSLVVTGAPFPHELVGPGGVLSVWHPLQALGDPKANVAAEAGGSMEWSLRFMRAKEVMGMWHATHLLPALPSPWRVWAGAWLTRSSWHGRQALLASSVFWKR
jgi:hypothetical protein